jgi:endonuclease/exonuclease/phosphatase family metal-dependent hydrolase
VRGKDYRVVNTHLEQSQLGNDPTSAIFQSLQAVELVGTLLFTAPYMSTGRKLILLGDFNSSPDDPIGDIMPPYQIILGGGFEDVWDTNRFVSFDPGYTCCQDDDLANRRSLLDERIDLIFVRDASFQSYAFVVGRVPIFPLFWPPNWASDHGGVFAKLVFRDETMDWRAGRWWWRH